MSIGNAVRNRTVAFGEEGRTESSTRVTARPAVDPALQPRHAALSFLRPRELWSAMDIADFCQAQLFTEGYVQLHDPLSGRFALWESPIELPLVVDERPRKIPTVGQRGDRVAHGFMAELPTSPFETPAPDATSRVAPLIAAARERTLVALRGLVLGDDDSFVRQALYAGRVARMRIAGHTEARWTPVLREGQPFSAWILALFACDVLRCRGDYEQRATVCWTCGLLGFEWAGGPRTECPAHRADAAQTSGKASARSTTTPEVPEALRNLADWRLARQSGAALPPRTVAVWIRERQLQQDSRWPKPCSVGGRTNFQEISP